MLTCRVLNTHIPTNRVCAILTRHFCPLGSLPCVPSSQADVRNEHHEGHSKPPPHMDEMQVRIAQSRAEPSGTLPP